MTTIGQVAKLTGKSWHTSDLWLGAHLQVKGFKLAEAKRQGERVVFIFSEDEKLTNEVQAFYNHESSVEPMGYKAQINKLRDIAEDVKRGMTIGRDNGNGTKGN